MTRPFSRRCDGSSSWTKFCDRRHFLSHAAVLGTACWLGLRADHSNAEPPPEVSALRLVKDPTICFAPEYLAEELLKAEGFAVVDYIHDADVDPDANVPLVADKADLALDTAPALVTAIDKGAPLVLLAGVHGGCWELFGNKRVRGFRDLRGKGIAITSMGSTEHIYIASMMAYVGMNPHKDVRWIEGRTEELTMQLFVDGGADVFLGFPPQPQVLRAKRIGHVILNTARDRPWSQYFCCVLTARQDFAAKYPVATKRALRAILKAADICAREPERAARHLVEKGYESSYSVALEVMREVSYNAWRLLDPEATVRFHALRLREVGMIKGTPQKIIAQGTDWRFLNEVKKELKA